MINFKILVLLFCVVIIEFIHFLTFVDTKKSNGFIIRKNNIDCPIYFHELLKINICDSNNITLEYCKFVVTYIKTDNIVNNNAYYLYNNYYYVPVHPNLLLYSSDGLFDTTIIPGRIIIFGDVDHYVYIDVDYGCIDSDNCYSTSDNCYSTS